MNAETFGGDIPIKSKESVAAVPVADAAANGGSQGSSSPRLAADFEVTPLFTVLQTTMGGAASVSFTAPQSLGSFLIRAYAANGQRALYGASESLLVVRRSLSLVPSIPRFVRVGDEFEAGVIMTISPNSPPLQPVVIKVLVALTGGDLNSSEPLKVTSFMSQDVEIGINETQKEVRFSFSAVEIGNSSIKFSANDEMGSRDSLQVELEVLPQQEALQVATSFALNSSDEAWQEGLDLPEAVPGSGSLDLVADSDGCDSLEGLMSLAPVATRGGEAGADSLGGNRHRICISAQSVWKNFCSNVEDPDGTSAVVLATAPNTYAHYLQTATPQLMGNASTAASHLSILTAKAVGLMHYKPRQMPRSENLHADIQLNGWAAWLVDGMNKNGAVDAQVSDSYWDSITMLSLEWKQKLLHLTTHKWKQAAASQLVKDATQARNAEIPRPYSDMQSLAWARLALGTSWSPNPCRGSSQWSAETLGPGPFGPSFQTTDCATAEVIEDLSTERMADESQPINEDYMAFIENVTTTTLSSLRVQGRTAYVSSVSEGNEAAGLTTQALALLVLVQSQPAGSAQMVYAPLCVRPSATSVGLAIRALTEYDVLRGSTAPNLTLDARVQDTLLMQASFTPSNASVVSSSTPWEDLPSPPGSVSFDVNGSGEVSLVVSLGFVPKDLITFPLYRGIWVESTIQLIDSLSGTAKGPGLGKVPLGTPVKYTIQVPMPGGLEPLDPNLVNGASSCVMGSIVTSKFWWWWWPICPSQETRPSMVSFRYQRLMAGTSTVQFQAVAATPGTFVRPPISAYASLQPELRGSTAGGYFTVCPNAPACNGAASGTDLEPGPMKNCPGNCGGANGICRPDSGACVCKEGFGGDDCSIIEQS
eukprot:gene14425-20431_t